MPHRTRFRHARFLGVVTGLVLITALAVFVYAWQWLHRDMPLPANANEQRLFEIKPGDNVGLALERFANAYGLEHRLPLKIYARVAGLTRIKQGEYLLPARVSPIRLLQIFNQGKVRQHSFTLVEGTTVNEALVLLGSQVALQRTLEHVSAEVIAERLGIADRHLEGWLFPDTYYYVKGSSDWSLLQRAHQRMRDILATEWQMRSADLPIHTPYEALILASIVEKETGAHYERERIAGVFVRRLQRGMRLQTDPTIIYGQGSDFDGNITRQHLRQANPYNTYLLKGLPPTPIALPGREAIHAVLHPAAGDSLYFVARGDGTHVFSATLAQHRQAVDQFQRKRVDNYRSSLK